ncbi:DUF305 domain-containing protein [Streptomyces sp. NPDC059828]|uniref:DUF305 domain-containing protein n=1 Tax=Streptomyces sp. NPDC059828 TaxID=3346965 RepID=UPI0036595C72
MSTHRCRIRRTVAATAAGAAALVLAACGSNSQGPAGHAGHSPAPSAASASASASAAPGSHGDADVAFAQGMIPHHRQAVEMAGLAATRAESTEVKELAEEIRKAQDPEIETLTGWLAAWGEQVPADGAMDHSAHSQPSRHSGDGSGGMMTDEETAELGKSSGAAFDTVFMKLMIKHHEGAVAMARTEQAEGAYGPARKMAGGIVTSQTAEITRMNRLLGQS